MGFLFVPDIKLRSIYEITPELLKEKGISLLLIDMDNTLMPYLTETPTDELLAWRDRMRNEGITLFVISNNRSERLSRIAVNLDIPYVGKAAKPSRKEIWGAMKKYGKEAKETALAGDQAYIDVFAASRCKILSILVNPIKFTNFFLILRYIFELPFRAMRRYGI
jgi:HAD superfamily phosphatase (TIGR01668 family)